MLKQILEHGVGVAAGLLVGIVLVFWIKPTTTGGVGLLILVAVLSAYVLERVYFALFR